MKKFCIIIAALLAVGVQAETVRLVAPDGSDYESSFEKLRRLEIVNGELLRLVDENEASVFVCSATGAALVITDEEPTPEYKEIGSGDENGKYSLVWADYFDGSELNRNAWNIEVNGNGGGNNELQYYCEEAVSVGPEPVTGHGCLTLTASRENRNGKSFTSGRVNSKNNVHFQYGKIEASICFPYTGNGLWPAYWMMGNDIDQVSWPACGEIDIVELGDRTGIDRGTQDRHFSGAAHWGQDWYTHQYFSQDYTHSTPVEGGFHLFTCVWDENSISYYLDKDKNPNAQPYFVLTSWNMSDFGKYFRKHDFLLFNLAVGGDFMGIYSANEITALSAGPASMYVDYVLVYQQNPDIYVNQGATGIFETQQTTPVVKYMQDGQLIIRRDGHQYNVMGTLLK